MTMSKFDTLNDSGGRKEYETGMQREGDEGRGMPSLISPYMLTRLSQHMENGARKYSAHNWMMGANYQRFIDSMYRHLIAFQKGDTSEDHLSAIIFNAMAIIHFDETGRAEELDDRVDGKGMKILDQIKELTEEDLEKGAYGKFEGVPVFEMNKGQIVLPNLCPHCSGNGCQICEYTGKHPFWVNK